MGGPGARVLLREQLSNQKRTNAETWIQSIVGQWYKESDSSVSQFWLKEELFGEPMSCCLFYLSIEEPAVNPDLVKEEEVQQMLAQLGYFPQQAICISFGCNQEDDHSTPGLLILHLAETYYDTSRHTRWVHLIVDATFLRAWMNNPNFYMVK